MLPVPEVARRAADLAREYRATTVWFGASAPLGLLGPGLRRRAGIERVVASTHGHEVGWSMLPAARRYAAFVAIASAYPASSTIDPAGQVAGYSAATDEALAAGYTGLRVVADATPLVRTAEQVTAFTRYEHLIDRYMCDHPFAAMCAFNRAELTDDVIAALACLHPQSNADPPFSLRACPPDQGSAVLSGELDLRTYDLLNEALDAVAPQPVDGEVVLRADGLALADHRSLTRLDDYAARHDITIVLRAAPAAIGRLAAVLDLNRLRVEEVVR